MPYEIIEAIDAEFAKQDVCAGDELAYYADDLEDFS